MAGAAETAVAAAVAVAVAAARHATVDHAVKAGRVARSRARRHRGPAETLVAEAEATVGDEGAQRKRRRRPRKPRAEGVATTVEVSVVTPASAEPKSSGDTPKLRTRLKQKVKSFLAVFRGGRH